MRAHDLGAAAGTRESTADARGNRLTRAPLSTRRVAVVTSRLRPGFNELWDTARHGVGGLSMIGARAEGDTDTVDPSRIALPYRDLGRGLIWQHLSGLRRFLRTTRPDLVHVNRELWAVVAQEVVGLDTTVVVHGAENLWHHGGGLEQALRRRLVDRAVRRIRGYASWNHAGADHIVRRRAELGLATVPTVVLPAVVPPRPFRDAGWQPGPADPLEILLVGRAVPEKGYADVLEAAAGMDGVRVSLCGEGPALDDVRALAARLGVPLDTLGHLQPHRLAELMARCHVLVQPSRTTPDWAEQFGRTVAEAMTVGLPCLVSDSGELPHLVGGAPEAIFPEGDAAAIRAHLQRLTDARAREALAAQQGALATVWQPHRAAEALLDFWEQALS